MFRVKASIWVWWTSWTALFVLSIFCTIKGIISFVQFMIFLSLLGVLSTFIIIRGCDIYVRMDCCNVSILRTSVPIRYREFKRLYPVMRDKLDVKLFRYHADDGQEYWLMVTLLDFIRCFVFVAMQENGGGIKNIVRKIKYDTLCGLGIYNQKEINDIMQFLEEIVAKMKEQEEANKNVSNKLNYVRLKTKGVGCYGKATDSAEICSQTAQRTFEEESLESPTASFGST